MSAVVGQGGTDEEAPADGLRAFAVRLRADGHRYGWEIRRHGGLLVRRDEGPYGDAPAAKVAGEAALAALRAVP